MRKSSSFRLGFTGLILFLGCFILVEEVQAQPQMPSKGFEQFRKNITEIESPEEKLNEYLQASVRFSPRMPDSVFVIAAEVKKMEGLKPQEQKAYYNFILANAWRTVNKDSVVHYAALATQELKKVADHDSYLRMENLLGLELSRQRKYIEADSIFKEAIAYSQTLEQVDYPVKYFYGNLGSLYSSVGAHDLAIEMYTHFLDEEDSPGNRCSIVSKLAVSLAEISEYSEAIQLLSPCLEYSDLPPPIMSIVRSNLSRMYFERNEQVSGLRLMEEAVSISTQNRVPNLEISQTIELGKKYLEMERIEDADSVRILLERLILHNRNPHFNIDKNIFFAELELVHENYQQSLHYASQAIEIANQTGLNHHLKDIYLTRSKAYEELGDFKQALANTQLHTELEEESDNEEAERKLAMMKVRYQLYDKEAELISVNDELKTVQVRDVIIMLLLVLTSLFLIYKFRIHYILQEQETRNKIARDLHDDLSGTLSSISFFSEAAKRVQQKTDDSLRYLKMIDRSAVEAKEKINDIIWAIDPQNDDWSTFLKKCKRFAADALDSKEIGYKLEIADNFTIASELQIRQNLWLIFKEIVNNLVVHSEAENAKVIFKQEGDTIILKVSDDGIGFNTGENNDRHGLKNIKYRAEQINASVSLKSSVGQGTVWKMELKN